MSTYLQSERYPVKEMQSRSIYTYDEDYHPSKHERLLFRNKPRKVFGHEDNNYLNHDEYDDFTRRTTNNGYLHHVVKENDNEADRLYRESREKFASWDIKDLDHRSPVDKRSINVQPSRRILKIPEKRKDVEIEDRFVNGDSSLSPSPTRKKNGTSERRSNSVTRRYHSSSESPEMKTGKARGKKTVETGSEEDEEEKFAKNGVRRNRSFKGKDHFGSLKKKNEKNAGLNKGFRAIIDKFRTKSDDKDKKDVQKIRKPEYVDEDWRYDDRNRKERKSPEKIINYPSVEYKIEKNHKTRDYEYERESSRRRTPSDDEARVEKSFRVRYRDPSVERDSRSRTRSPSYDRDYRSPKEKHYENDRSKRRSYAFESTPEDFEVPIQKYERAPGNDSRVHRRNSFNDRNNRDSDSSQRTLPKTRPGANIVRKSSLKNKGAVKYPDSIRSKPPKPRLSERHSRPLTPPRDQPPLILTHNFRHETSIEDDKISSKKEFSMKDWYESNRQFATKYLKEHSKIKELSTFSDVSAKDEFVFSSSPKDDSKIVYQVESHLVRKESFDRDNSDDRRSFSSIDEQYTKVLKNMEDSPRRKWKSREEEIDESMRRNHHESLDEEDEDDYENEQGKKEISRRSTESYGRSFVMPSRRAWNYRDGV